MGTWILPKIYTFDKLWYSFATKSKSKIPILTTRSVNNGCIDNGFRGAFCTFATIATGVKKRIRRIWGPNTNIIYTIMLQWHLGYTIVLWWKVIPSVIAKTSAFHSTWNCCWEVWLLAWNDGKLYASFWLSQSIVLSYHGNELDNWHHSPQRGRHRLRS